MTIGLLTPYFPDQNTINSGIGNHIEILANALVKEGQKVVVLHIREIYAGEQSGVEETHLNNYIIVLAKIANPKWAGLLLRKRWAARDFLNKIKAIYTANQLLRTYIKKYNIDIIEASSYNSLALLYVFSKGKTPVVHRVSTPFAQIFKEHLPYRSRLLTLFGRLEIEMLKRAHYLVTHTIAHAREMEKQFELECANFNIIPHGIEMKAFVENNKVSQKEISILYVGRMEYRKGIDILLKAIPLVLKENPCVIFHLIGQDSKNEYSNAFRELFPSFINKNVFFLGTKSKDELLEAYKNCDIFVAPSRYESFGMIYIEAMSFAKPVIGCKTGGVPEIINDNYNGLLITNEDHYGLAKSILRLSSDSILRTKLGNNAIKTVSTKFTASKLADSTIKHFESIIKNGSS